MKEGFELQNYVEGIMKNINEHNKQLEVDNIYSYGFSFSEVDLPYIRRICGSIETDNVVWYINDYDKVKCYRSIIKRCGFKGKLSKFRVKK